MLIRNLSKKVEKVNVLSPPSGHVSRVLSLCSKFGHVDSKCPKHPPNVVQWTSNPLKMIQCIKNYYFGLLDQGISPIGSKIRLFFAYTAYTHIWRKCEKQSNFPKHPANVVQWTSKPLKMIQWIKNWCFVLLDQGNWPIGGKIRPFFACMAYTHVAYMAHMRQNCIILLRIGQFPWFKRPTSTFRCTGSFRGG